MTSATPPSDPASLLNCTVKIQNVISKPHLNSQMGLVKSYNFETNRYNIQLLSSPPTQPIAIALKAENLVQASTLLDRANGYLQQAKGVIADPNVLAQYQRMYNLVNDKLRSMAPTATPQG